MTTIRNLCCNDLLDMTHLLMDDQIATIGKDRYGSVTHIMIEQMTKYWEGFLDHKKNRKKYGPFESFMYYALNFPHYNLVALSPGCRIKGYSASCIIDEKGFDKYCEITKMSCIGNELAEMFGQTIEEKAVKIDKVYYLETDVHSSNQKDLNLSKNLGFNWNVELPAKCMKILKKDSLQKALLDALKNY